jgi:hypothetical protein
VIANGDVWELHDAEGLVARLTVTGSDFPWVHGRVETLPGYERVRELYEINERAIAAEDDDAIDAVWPLLQQTTSLHAPDGQSLESFWLDIYSDGTCGWRG